MITGNQKYANEILDDVECYKAVLDGRLNRFPRGFWTKPWSLESAAVILRYLLEDKLKYTEEDIKKVPITKLLKAHKLSSIVHLFSDPAYSVINNAYPGRFKPWELSSVPLGFWENKDNIIKAVKWVVETKLDNNRQRVCNEFNQELLDRYGLVSLTRLGIFKVLNMAYPNEFKPWELSTVTNGFWDNKNNIIEAVRWLVETKLDNNKERVKNEFNSNLLKKYNLKTVSHHGIYTVLNMAYPNEFSANDFKAGNRR